MNTLPVSPTNPTHPIYSGLPFDFPEAMRRIIHGDRITKLEWGSSENYAELRDGFLMIHNPDGWHTWIVRDADMFGTDWILYEPILSQ